jgi:ubiquinone/menaquinone biosynthesis C-methylase UbiE
MTVKSSVPAYESMLAAYHRGFAPELRAMIKTLPISFGQSVLDMACGDGVYAPWLAERVGSSGRVVAVDIVPEYLELARDEAARSSFGPIIEFVLSPIESLPFKDGCFDLCWCAQSLYSLPDPVQALRHLSRVTRPGGCVAVLEADSLHEVILPWPIEIELSVRAAELQAFVASKDSHAKFYIGRELRRIFREAGLDGFRQRSFAIDRLGPFKADERIFFGEYLNRLSKKIGRFLDPTIRDEFLRLVDPDSDTYLLDDPDLTAICVGHVVWGRKPLA